MDSFTDPARGKTAALSQIDEGADVIFGAGGPTGSGAILGAAQMGVWGGGIPGRGVLLEGGAERHYRRLPAGGCINAGQKARSRGDAEGRVPQLCYASQPRYQLRWL